MRVHIASIPTDAGSKIADYVAGAEAVLNMLPNASGNDPMRIEVDHLPTGNSEIYLATGRWVGPYTADFGDNQLEQQEQHADKILDLREG